MICRIIQDSIWQDVRKLISVFDRQKSFTLISFSSSSSIKNCFWIFDMNICGHASCYSWNGAFLVLAKRTYISFTSLHNYLHVLFKFWGQRYTLRAYRLHSIIYIIGRDYDMISIFLCVQFHINCVLRTTCSR